MMANIKIKNRKVLAVIIAFAMVLGLVAPIVIVKAANPQYLIDINNPFVDMLDGTNEASVTVEGLETNKTATALGNDEYKLNLEAFATSASLKATPTDFALVLDMSGSMETRNIWGQLQSDSILYTRDKTNLLNHTTFKKVSLANSTHNDLYDPNNPLNPEGISFSIKYGNNRYVEDPNHPGTYVYLAQTFSSSGMLNTTNNYQYFITDIEGHHYSSQVYSQNVIITGGNEIITLFPVNNIKFTLQNDAGDGAIKEFTITDFYQRSDDIALSSDLYAKANSAGGLWLKDDYGELCQVHIDVEKNNSYTKTTTTGIWPFQTTTTETIYFPTKYIYTYTDSKGKNFTVNQANNEYGADYGVFQGFKTYDSNGNVIHDESVEHRTLYEGGKNEQVTKLLALKEAVEDFILEVHKDAYINNVDQRISIHTFAGSGKTPEHMQSIKEENAANALVEKVYTYTASGATRTDYGMQQAYNELTNYSKGRNTVSVVFTDGVPSSMTDFSTTIANSAISYSKRLKDNLGTKVYTVGLFAFANKNQTNGDKFYYFGGDSGPIWNNVVCNGNVGSTWGATSFSSWTQADINPIDAAACNRFLNYLSSNYDASNIGVTRGNYNPGGYILTLGGTGYRITKNYDRESDKYYFGVDTYDAANDRGREGEAISREIMEAFKNIADSVQIAATNLHEDAMLIDTVSDYFDLSSIDPSSIRVYTVDYLGNETWSSTGETSSKLKATIESTSSEDNAKPNKIVVTGFDYSNNYISESDRADYGKGKKVCVELTVKRNENFIGGHNVPTNGSDSGVYDSKERLESTFPMPLVDLDLQFENGVSDQYIYYGNNANLAEFVDDSTIDGVNNAFVNVKYIIKDGDETVVEYTFPAGSVEGISSLSNEELIKLYPILKDNKNYSVDVIVETIDRNKADTESLTTDDSATVFVYKPVVNVENDETYYGDYSISNPSVEWVAEGTSEAAPVEGKPNLQYSIMDITKEQPVPDTDINNYPLHQDTEFQITAVTIPEHQFTYQYNVEAPVFETDEEGNQIPVYEVDENGNSTGVQVMGIETVTETVTVPAIVNDEANNFVTFRNKDDERTDGSFSVNLYRFDLNLTKEFKGDYANPENVTFDIIDANGNTKTVEIAADEFNGLTATKVVKDLYAGVEYTVVETSVDSNVYEVTYSNDGKVFTDIANDTKDMTITNTMKETAYPPVTGTNSSNIAHIVATIMFVLAGILGVGEVSYIAYLRIRS